MRIYTSLNNAGKAHVDERLIELGLDWDRNATYQEIEQRCTDVPENDYPRDFAVSQHLSKSGQIDWIYLTPEHFNTETIDD